MMAVAALAWCQRPAFMLALRASCAMISTCAARSSTCWATRSAPSPSSSGGWPSAYRCADVPGFRFDRAADRGDRRHFRESLTFCGGLPASEPDGVISTMRDVEGYWTFTTCTSGAWARHARVSCHVRSRYPGVGQRCGAAPAKPRLPSGSHFHQHGAVRAPELCDSENGCAIRFREDTRGTALS